MQGKARQGKVKHDTTRNETTQPNNQKTRRQPPKTKITPQDKTRQGNNAPHGSPNNVGQLSVDQLVALDVFKQLFVPMKHNKNMGISQQVISI